MVRQPWTVNASYPFHPFNPLTFFTIDRGLSTVDVFKGV